MAEFTAEQQAELDRLIGEARVKAREVVRKEFDAAQAKEREDTEQANLAAQNKWQQLAEGLKARVATLEPLEEQVKQYQESFDGMLRARVKALGDKAKKALDTLPASMTAAGKLTWLDANEDLFLQGNSVGTPDRTSSDREVSKSPQGPVSRFPIKL